jgi:hypothetical protein
MNFRSMISTVCLIVSRKLLQDLQNRPDTIEVASLGDLCLIILEIMGWTNTAYMENSLGISPSLLNRFVKMRGTLKKRDALKVADRVRSLSEERGSGVRWRGACCSGDGGESRDKEGELLIAPSNGCSSLELRKQSKKINLISVLLDSIIVQVRGANAPEGEQLLSEIERQQLIAILETALNILKSPLLETGMLSKVQKTLKEASVKAAEGTLQKGLGKLMGAGADKISELLISLLT